MAYDFRKLLGTVREGVLKSRRRRFAAPVLGSIVLVALIFLFRPGLQEKAVVEESRAMNVIQVPVTDVVPRAMGYGTIEPRRVWQAVSRVSGHILEINPNLRSGAHVPAGALLLRIDPREFQLEIDKIRAEIDNNRAAQKELEHQKENDEASLAIEMDILQVLDRDLKRNTGLHKKGVISRATLDKTHREWLHQKQAVQRLESALRLVPSKRQSLAAGLAISRTKLAAAELQLSYTEIRAPFDLRLADVALQPGQFVAAGKSLFEAHGSAASEIHAQVSYQKFQHLLSTIEAQGVRTEMFGSTGESPRINDYLRATVRQFNSAVGVARPGRVVGVRERVDAATRTYGIVVAIDDPYGLGSGDAEKQPPLIKGAYSEVEFWGEALPKQVIVPLSAISFDNVYIVNADGRLERRAVDIRFQQNDFAVIRSGLTGGETLVATYPSSAFDGLLVQKIADEKVMARLVAAARGPAAPEVRETRAVQGPEEFREPAP